MIGACCKFLLFEVILSTVLGNSALTSVMRVRSTQPNKSSPIDAGSFVANGGTQNLKTGMYSDNIQEVIKNFERSSNLPKKRKHPDHSESDESNKMVRSSNEDNVNVNLSPTSLHGESDAHEHDDSPSDLQYANENSFDENAEGSFGEDNEHFYEKDDIEDEDREDN